MSARQTGHDVYVAEWIEAIHEPPTGRDFSPTRDIDKVLCGGFSDAASAARFAQSKDIHGEGQVHRYERKKHGLVRTDSWAACEVTR